MKKKRIQHHRQAAFTDEGEMISPVAPQRRILTAEGYRRRSANACPTRSVALYRGRRQGKG